MWPHLCVNAFVSNVYSIHNNAPFASSPDGDSCHAWTLSSLTVYYKAVGLKCKIYSNIISDTHLRTNLHYHNLNTRYCPEQVA